MRLSLVQVGFLNAGHAITHLMLLLYPTVVLALEREMGRTYADLIALSTWSFAALGLATWPAGWLGDRMSRKALMVVFFLGIGASAVLTGLAQATWQIAAGLALIGAFAAIYHPVGIALLADAPAHLLGRVLGVNGVFGNVGLALAPFVGGALVAALSWRAAFVVPGVVAILVGLLYAVLGREAGRGPAARREAAAAAVSAADIRRILVVLGVATIASGFIFGGTTVSLPKLVEERWAASVGSLAAVGGATTAVLLVAATAQILMGALLDRHRLRPLYATFAALQAPLLAVVAFAGGPSFLAATTGLMFVVFGLIPIGDVLVARFVPFERRARVYAAIYVLSFGVGTAAVPALAWIEAAVGLQGYYLVLAVLGAAELAVALALPAVTNRRASAAVPELAQAE